MQSFVGMLLGRPAPVNLPRDGAGERMISTVRMGVFSQSVVVSIGRAHGVFDDAGIDLEVTPVRSSVAAFTALANKELDVLVTSPDNVLAYRLNGSNALGRRLDAQVFLAVDRGLGLSLFRSPAAPAPGASAMVTLAVDAPATGFAYAAYSLLASLGLQQHSDYVVVEAGTTPARRDGLVAGVYDLTMLNAGHDAAAEAVGCGRGPRVVDTVGPYLGSVLTGLESWAAANPARLTALRRAWLQAAALAVDPMQRATVETQLQESLACATAAAGAAADVLTSEREGLVLDGQVRRDELQTVMDLRAAFGGFDSGATPSAMRSVDDGLVRPGA
jgi:ABC-type nitrate/sulfonate/bicarbonate transport system substrate-binding protein